MKTFHLRSSAGTVGVAVAMWLGVLGCVEVVAEDVSFSVIPTTEPVTSMALSEDGRFLALSHQGAGTISIWNVVRQTFGKPISTPSPRAMLYRGNRLIVANDGEGTVSVFQQKGEWKQIKQVKLPTPHIVHLSAAQGSNYKDELLATTHGKGVSASYQSSAVHYVNLKTGKSRPVSRAPMASVSHDGKIVITQQSFNLSPSGQVAGYRWSQYITGRTDGSPVFRGAGPQQVPYVYQAHRGSYWLANNLVMGGIPMTVVKKDIGKILIPDLAQPVVYAVTLTGLTAHRLNVELSELGRRTAEFPTKQTKDFVGMHHTLYRQRNYLLDHPIAFTRGETLYLFAIDMKSNVVLAARTTAFSIPDAKMQIAGTVPAIPEPKPGVGKPTTKTPSGNTPSKPVGGTPGVTNGKPQNFGVPTRVVAKQFLVHSLNGPNSAKYQLVKGPKRMRLNNRMLTWQPDISEVGKHEIQIKVTNGSKITYLRPRIEVVFKATGGNLADLKGIAKLPMEINHWQLTPGLGYRSLLLLQGETLKQLGPDGLTVKRTMKFGNAYRYIAERADVFLAVSMDPYRLDVIDKKTLRTRKQIALASPGVRVMDVMDLAIHPKRHISYVTIKYDVELPRYRVLMVDETTGTVQAPISVMGTWLAADPSGRNLYAAYRDSYERGARFHINPGGNVIRIPKYGNIDWMIKYDLRRDIPKPRQVVYSAGGNSSGIRLSADGKRIVYLSHVGYPMFSNNLAAFDPSNLKTAPVTYPTKEAGAVTTMLAFHPSLDLVAVPGRKPAELPAMIFDRETGKPLPAKLSSPPGGLGSAKIEHVVFAPDGRSLIFVCSGIDGLTLLKLPLKLSPSEVRRAVQGAKIPVPASTELANIVVKRQDLDALKKPTGGATVKAKEIARAFTQSVVLIQSDEATASGFVVGSRGYILTCAHAIPDDGGVKVSYQSSLNGRTTTRTAVARLIRFDEKHDLALLKIDPVGTLNAVSIADEQSVDAGEEVTVIGNPGLGSKVLTNTLTTGIVSSPKRLIEGETYIQTSATVNPGNSGGPMFDSRGRVIGLVALKARIENTGFAVPAVALRVFLEAATKKVQTTGTNR